MLAQVWITYVRNKKEHMKRFISNLDLEGPLESAGEESSKRPHDGGEAGQSDAVDLEGVKLHRGLEQTEDTLNTSASVLLRKVFHKSSEETWWVEKEVTFMHY